MNRLAFPPNSCQNHSETIRLSWGRDLGTMLGELYPTSALIKRGWKNYVLQPLSPNSYPHRAQETKGINRVQGSPRLKGFIKLLQKIVREAMVGRTDSPALRADNKLCIKKDAAFKNHHHAMGTLMVQELLSWPCSYGNTSPTSYKQPNKSHWLTWGGIASPVCCCSPMWGEKMFAYCSPGKVTRYHILTFLKGLILISLENLYNKLSCFWFFSTKNMQSLRKKLSMLYVRYNLSPKIPCAESSASIS